MVQFLHFWSEAEPRGENAFEVFEEAIGDGACRALDHILEYVGEAEPASVSGCVGQTWFLFSDGAYELHNAHAATIGAVLVDPCGRVCSFFGEALDDECRDIFTKSSCHPIYELEILPVVVAVECWKDFISGKQLVCYIDSSAAQAAFLGATGATELASALLEAYTWTWSVSAVSFHGSVEFLHIASDPASRLEVNHPLLPERLRVSVDIALHLGSWGLASGAR